MLAIQTLIDLGVGLEKRYPQGELWYFLGCEEVAALSEAEISRFGLAQMRGWCEAGGPPAYHAAMAEFAS